MKYAAAVGSLLLVLCLVRAAACQPFAHAAPPVSGRVVDAITGRPVAGAAVLVYWPGARAAPPYFFDALAVRETVTDASGRFTIPGWQSDALTSRPGDVEPRLYAIAPGYAVGTVAVGWRGGDALQVPLDLPRSYEISARHLAFMAASLGFLAASLEGDAPLALVDAVDREWQALPPEDQKGQASVKPLFAHARREGRALIAEWKRQYPDGAPR